jgi:hypothetical protein
MVVAAFRRALVRIYTVIKVIEWCIIFVVLKWHCFDGDKCQISFVNFIPMDDPHTKQINTPRLLNLKSGLMPSLSINI